jgi:arsenite methyltransferase
LASSAKLGIAQRAVLGLPLGHGRKPITDEQGASRGAGHPGRDAHAFFGRGLDYLGVHVRVDRDGELWRWPSSGHDPNSTTTVGAQEGCRWCDCGGNTAGAGAWQDPAMRTGGADYGFDAPHVVVGVMIAAMATTIVGLVAAPAVLIAGAGFWFGVVAMVWGSRVGKRRWARSLVGEMTWRGDERVLDVGCGRGLLLIEAAKRLNVGRAVGADLWSTKDQSGNRPTTTRRNATVEDVADRVDIITADASWLPFRDGAFDVVVSGLALHNIRSTPDRRQAMRELGRVLKAAGRVAVFDIEKSHEYVQELASGGLADVKRSRMRPPFLVPLRTVTAHRHFPGPGL